jgi:hypothetical protein
MKKVTKAKQTKYTPGPWCVDDAIRGQLYVMSKSSCFIADLQLPEADPDEHAEVRANACLIAEAPNLLEACRAKEFFEPRLFLWLVRFPFHELKFLGLPWGESAV